MTQSDKGGRTRQYEIPETLELYKAFGELKDSEVIWLAGKTPTERKRYFHSIYGAASKFAQVQYNTIRRRLGVEHSS